MDNQKKAQESTKTRLHVRNKHRERYNLLELVEASEGLKEYVIKNKYGDDSIPFASAKAVMALNKALLIKYYGMDFWEIPEGYLCPPIPGRADYLHHAADLFGGVNYGKIPKGSSIKVLDVGVGSNCVYPIIGTQEYGWSFVGSEIDDVSIRSSKEIIAKNERLQNLVEIRKQENIGDVLKGIIQFDEKFDLVICNPPFHATMEEAEAGNLRKLSNLKSKKVKKLALNFGGQESELVTEGGERQFVRTFVRQSKRYSSSCFWYTSLISKESNLRSIQEKLRIANAEKVVTIPMGQGNKSSRIIAWTFLDKEQRIAWAKERWQDPKD